MTWRTGWRARGLALTCGLAAGFAHPPFGVLPGLLGFGLLLALLDTSGPRPLRSAFLRGWLCGVGYFAVGVHWITEPFLVDAKTQGWMAPFALVLMAGGLALFWGAAAAVFRAARVRGPAGVVVFAGIFAGAEWLRGHIFTGFPWDLVGETWRAGSAMSQAAAFVGAYGLTWITLVIAAAPGVLLLPIARGRKIAALAMGLALWAGLFAVGAARLNTSPPPSATAPMLRVVQANIDQKEKWKPENLGLVFDAYAELTSRPAAVPPAIVLWPEGALPAVIDDLMAPGSIYATRLRDLVPPGQTLMMGVNRVEASPNSPARYFNSLMAFRREGPSLRVVAVYDKHQLVPFGEYMPLGDLAAKVGFRSLVHMVDDFTAGPEPAPITPQGLPPTQVLICYEALFPGVTRAAETRSGVRPAWILNVSNDAWFGTTSGPLQHLNIASFRAIEEGLPIVRVTPTGVSAVIDAYGRIRPGESLGAGVMSVIDAKLPPALRATPYSKWGDLFFALMVLFSALIAIGYRVHRAP